MIVSREFILLISDMCRNWTNLLLFLNNKKKIHFGMLFFNSVDN